MGVEVNHLHETVDARVGSARAQGRHFGVDELRQGPLKGILQGGLIALTLPAGVVSALETQAQGDSNRRALVRQIRHGSAPSCRSILQVQGDVGHFLKGQRQALGRGGRRGGVQFKIVVVEINRLIAFDFFVADF